MNKNTLLTSLVLTAMPAFAAPIYNIFELGIADGETAAYDQIGAENIYSSLANEPGTLAMYSVKSPENPQLAYMIEIYADDAAYQAHRETPHFQKYLQETAAMLQEKNIRTLTPTLLQNQGGVHYDAP